MSEIKIIFFDIDGTIIDMNRKQITEKMLLTLKSLKEKGIKICLASGRPPIQLPNFPDIEFDAFLTFNGSFCYTKDQVIHKHALLKSDVKQIIYNAQQLNRALSVATKDQTMANSIDDDLIAYYGVGGFKVDVNEHFDQTIEQEEVYQMMISGTKDEYPLMLKDVKAATIAAWWNRAFDVIPKAGGKGIGVQKVLEHYGIDRMNALAFGDGGNDIEMLEAVGCGVAMGNALDEIKKIADEVCGSVADDGIYYYCKQKGLI